MLIKIKVVGSHNGKMVVAIGDSIITVDETDIKKAAEQEERLLSRFEMARIIERLTRSMLHAQKASKLLDELLLELQPHAEHEPDVGHMAHTAPVRQEAPGQGATTGATKVPPVAPPPAEGASQPPREASVGAAPPPLAQPDPAPAREARAQEESSDPAIAEILKRRNSVKNAPLKVNNNAGPDGNILTRERVFNFVKMWGTGSKLDKGIVVEKLASIPPAERMKFVKAFPDDLRKAVGQAASTVDGKETTFIPAEEWAFISGESESIPGFEVEDQKAQIFNDPPEESVAAAFAEKGYDIPEFK